MTEAKVFGSDTSRLKKLLNEAKDLHPNKQALASTGIGILMSDQTLWPQNHVDITKYFGEVEEHRRNGFPSRSLEELRQTIQRYEGKGFHANNDGIGG